MVEIIIGFHVDAVLSLQLKYIRQNAVRLFQFRLLGDYGLDVIDFLQTQIVLELLHVDPDPVQLDL